MSLTLCLDTYDLFASVRKAVCPVPKATGVQIDKHVIVSLSSNLPQKRSTVQSLPPPPPQSKIAGSVPVKGTAESMVAQKPLRIWRIGD